MTVDIWLAKTLPLLIEAGVLTAKLDCFVLLEDATGKNRSWLLAHPEHVVQGPELQKLNQQIVRRSKHEPLAYIRGKTEFYGRKFVVNENTLEPRPETETMIEQLKKLSDSVKMFVDVGTGSGAIAITAKILHPNVNVIATDIDNKCVQIAQQNAKQYNVSIEFYQGNLLEPLRQLITASDSWLILANLPYVPNNHIINQAAMFEPKHAIFGGDDGLDYYRAMFSQIDTMTNKPKYVLTESLPFQHNELESIAEKSNYVLYVTDDLIHVFTVSIADNHVPPRNIIKD